MRLKIREPSPTVEGKTKIVFRKNKKHFAEHVLHFIVNDVLSPPCVGGCEALAICEAAGGRQDVETSRVGLWRNGASA